jgi:hypothetical protein
VKVAEAATEDDKADQRGPGGKERYARGGPKSTGVWAQ